MQYALPNRNISEELNIGRNYTESNNGHNNETAQKKTA
jgi:hypothetical protein